MILNYFGSKARSIEKINRVIAPLLNKETVFGDLFAGTGVVSNHFKNSVKQVISNDLELYSYVLNRALLTTVYTQRLQELVQSLNNIEPIKGLVYYNYSPACDKLFFTCENAQKIDAVRTKLNNMYQSKHINYKEFIFLLASLLYSVTRYANTAGTFRAFLKKFHCRSTRQFVLSPVHTDRVQHGHHKVINQDALKSCSQYKYDVVYLDPPYNSHHYGAYYSFFNYLCIYSADVKISENTGVMLEYNKSSFGLKQTVYSSFQKLYKDIKAEKIFLHYNSNGILSKKDIMRILLEKGEGAITVYKFVNRNYKPNAMIKNNSVIDYLFLFEKGANHDIREIWM